VLLSGWLIRLIVVLSANNLPRLGQINLNSNVLLFAVSISLLTALLFGLAPALQNARINLQDVLKESTTRQPPGTRDNTFVAPWLSPRSLSRLCCSSAQACSHAVLRHCLK